MPWYFLIPLIIAAWALAFAALMFVAIREIFE